MHCLCWSALRNVTNKQIKKQKPKHLRLWQLNVNVLQVKHSHIWADFKYNMLCWILICFSLFLGIVQSFVSIILFFYLYSFLILYLYFLFYSICICNLYLYCSAECRCRLVAVLWHVTVFVFVFVICICLCIAVQCSGSDRWLYLFL